MLSAIGCSRSWKDLGPKFERTTGHSLRSRSALPAGVKRAQVAKPSMSSSLRGRGSTLSEERQAAADNVTTLASPHQRAVRKGAARPYLVARHVETRAAGREVDFLCRAGKRRASGVHFTKVLDRLGIANEMKSKTVFPNPKTPAEVGPLVANGEAELGVHIIVELVPVAGIDIVGPLPGDLQNIIVFAAGVMASANDAEASKALVLSSHSSGGGGDQGERMSMARRSTLRREPTSPGAVML